MMCKARLHPWLLLFPVRAWRVRLLGRFRALRLFPPSLALLVIFGAQLPLEALEPVAPFAATGAFDEAATILMARCVQCHNPADGKGGLDLTSAEGLARGGEKGPVLLTATPGESLLLRRLVDGEMPPSAAGKAAGLSAPEVSVLRRWVEAGAVWPPGKVISLYEKTNEARAGLDWWSLQPLRSPEPLPHDAENLIDRHIGARLEAAGMTLAPPADRRTLLRRASFDLLGLPPTPQEVEAFVQDQSPGAWEVAVDRLLASPRYGERWARHWLDVVRFAETCGYERDQLKPGIWRYRDWVIQALNDDMPYDRFVTLQLAGDEVPERDESTVVATGMIRAGTWNDEPNDAADYRYERLEDMVNTTTSTFLGLTVKCARCHNHKFDPIPQTDYYRMASFFWAGYTGQEGLGGPSREQLGFDAFGWTDRGPTCEPIHLLYKGERLRPGPAVEPGFLSAIPALDRPIAPPPEGAHTTGRRLQLAHWITDPRNPLTPRVIVNRIWLHHFGAGLVRTPDNFGFKGELPTHPELLDALAHELVHPTVDGNAAADTAVALLADAPSAAPSQAASAEAAALSTPVAPARGSVPWSLKRLHKLLLLSRTYRQSSLHPRQEEYARKDPANRLLWRFPRQRLDAEALRDSLLAVSGELNEKMGGPSFYPAMSAEALEGLSRKGEAWQASSPSERARRSVYMMTMRSRLLPLMTAFDFPDTTLPCGQRDVTTVAPQSLALLNNEFVHERSAALARRVAREAGPAGAASESSVAPGATGGLRQRVAAAWQIVFQRGPDAAEMELAVGHLVEEEQRCRASEEERKGSQDHGAFTTAVADEPGVKEAMALWLRADRGVETDEEGRVRFWRDGASSGLLHPHDASQADPTRRPALVPGSMRAQPALRFDGRGTFLSVAGQVIGSPRFSLFAVATQRGAEEGAREIFSNWTRRGRSVTSVFLGTSGKAGLRFTDAFAHAGELSEPDQPLLLTAVSRDGASVTYQGRRLLASSGALDQRDLGAPYVIGAQGDYQAEWWEGEIAELLIYDRALSTPELESVWSYLEARYGFEGRRAPDPSQLALESLCHALFNTSEFVYVD